MAAPEWAPWWLGSGAVWLVVLNMVVGAIAVLSSRARGAPPSPSERLGGISRRASSAVLQRLRSFSIFSFPSACFNSWPDSGPRAAPEETEEPGTARKQTARPSAPALAPPAAAEVDDEEGDPNSMSMEEVYALVLAGKQRPEPTEEEVRRAEVDAKAEELIRGFREKEDDERQRRLASIADYTQMLRNRGVKEDERQRRLDSIANYTQMLRDRAARRRQPG